MKKLAILFFPILFPFIFLSSAHAQIQPYFIASNFAYNPSTQVLSFDISNATNAPIYWGHTQVDLWDYTQNDYVAVTGYPGDQYSNLSATCNQTHCTVTLTTVYYIGN